MATKMVVSMSGVSKEQVEKARNIDLLTYLQTRDPEELKPDGSGRYITKTHDSLVISNGKWIWNSRGIGGVSALDYLIKVKNVGFVEAVESLAGNQVPINFPITKIQSPPPKKIFYPPKPCQFAKNVISYLQHRGIHPDIIRKCIQNGTLYESYYKNSLVCVFAGKDENGNIRFASIRGINNEKKEDVPGSNKQFGFHLSPENTNSRHLMVFEAAVDVLSHATLQHQNNWNWSGHRLSLSGTSPIALLSFLERNPQINRITLHMDNDFAGLIAGCRIKKLLAENEKFSRIRVTVNPPRQGKDYNNVLLCRIEKKKQSQRTNPTRKKFDHIHA